MAQRHQHGHLRRAKRKRGPDVWEFLWREFSKDGRRRQDTHNRKRERVSHRVGRLNHIQSLKTNINKNRDFSALMKFEDVVGHYRQTELLAENKTEKTKTTYLVYLRKWMLPTWGAEYLHNIKAVDVE
jgi:hypothetical protein